MICLTEARRVFMYSTNTNSCPERAPKGKHLSGAAAYLESSLPPFDLKKEVEMVSSGLEGQHTQLRQVRSGADHPHQPRGLGADEDLARVCDAGEDSGSGTVHGGRRLRTAGLVVLAGGGAKRPPGGGGRETRATSLPETSKPRNRTGA